jgi:hypothetical protein
LVEIFLDALGFPEEIRRMHFGKFDKLAQGFHGLPEFLRKFFVFLILPGIAERREPRLQQRKPVFEISVETLEIVGKTPDFLGIHHCLGHVLPFTLPAAIQSANCLFNLASTRADGE